MKKLNELSNLFKLLSDPNRLKMVAELCKSTECNVGALSKCCAIDLSVVSRHLSKLKDAGVIEASKQGKEVIYSLKAKNLARILRKFADDIEKSNCCN